MNRQKAPFFATYGNCIKANDSRELLARLSVLDIDVPETGRSEHNERYSVVLYLKALATTDRLDYPFSAEKGEGPDFTLISGEQTIALEHSQAGAEVTQEAQTRLGRAAVGSVILGENTLVGVGERAERPPPWTRRERLGRWCELILECIQAKTRPERLQGYGTFDAYHLLVYDNTGVPVEPGILEAAGDLASKLSEWEDANDVRRRFSRISVLSDQRLLFDLREERAVLGVAA